MEFGNKSEAKSLLIHVSDDPHVCIIKDTIWKKRWSVTDAWVIVSRLNT